MAELKENFIPVYGFDPTDAGVSGLMPFGIVSCQREYIGKQLKERLRKLPHGSVQCDNPEHSDSSALRLALLGY